MNEDTPKKITDEEYEQKRRTLELRKLEAEAQDLQERLDEREMRRETKRSKSINNGKILKQIADSEKASQAHCNHKKGGNGAQGFVGGQGDDSQYAVLKHRMSNGDVWVRCLRCGKTWKPPIESDFTVKGKMDREAFEAAKKDYETAVAFTTRNQMSGSIIFNFSDGGKYYREVTKDSNLR